MASLARSFYAHLRGRALGYEAHGASDVVVRARSSETRVVSKCPGGVGALRRVRAHTDAALRGAQRPWAPSCGRASAGAAAPHEGSTPPRLPSGPACLGPRREQAGPVTQRPRRGPASPVEVIHHAEQHQRVYHHPVHGQLRHRAPCSARSAASVRPPVGARARLGPAPLSTLPACTAPGRRQRDAILGRRGGNGEEGAILERSKEGRS